jgi:hypothetical protein
MSILAVCVEHLILGHTYDEYLVWHKNRVAHFRAKHGASLKDLNPNTTSASKAKCFPIG